MDLTQGTDQEKKARAKKMMLWFGIMSLLMGFAGLTSAYIVSSTREDWLNDFTLPPAFFISTAVIILSSISYHLAKKSIAADKRKLTSIGLFITLLLGITFIILQIIGFSQIIEQGFYFTGATSSITTSFIYIIAGAHIAHVVAGLISLLVVSYNHLQHKYNSTNMLGLELGASFWHFLDLLWVYLILFLYFFG